MATSDDNKIPPLLSEAPILLAKGERDFPPCCENKEPVLLQAFSFTRSIKGVLVPAGASFAKVLLIGAGGAGGDYKAVAETKTSGGGGGGAGAVYTKDKLPVVAGQSFDLKIGQGGQGGHNNGCPGEDTTFSYAECVKVAKGGKGGGYGLTGGIGGKGGEGSGSARSGHSGENGTACFGGKGGKTKLCRCLSFQYGNGGNGGSKQETEPLLTVLTVPSSLVEGAFCLPKLNSCAANVCRPLPACRHDCDGVPCCPPEPALPAPNSTGNNGQDGYAELYFYGFPTEAPVCAPVQHIAPSGCEYEYYLDPNKKLCLIDSTKYPVRALLARPNCEASRLKIKLLHSTGLPVTIRSSTGGSFSLGAGNHFLNLIYLQGNWQIEASEDEVLSFYPTHQLQRALSLPCYLDPITADIFNPVALSADGTTALLGVPTDSEGKGAVFVFVKGASCWKFQAKLVASDATGICLQGLSVALSADGNTAAFGGPADDGKGAAWVFTRKAGSWTQQGSKIVSQSEEPGATGTSIALSANGNFLAVGAPYHLNASHVFTFSRDRDGFWTESDTIPMAANSAYALAMSAMGDVLAVRTASNELNVYRYVNQAWYHEATLLNGGSQPAYSGSIAFSADATTLAVGLPQLEAAGQVAIYIYKANTWQQQGDLLMLENSEENPSFGYNVSLTADGNTLAVGAPTANNAKGGVHIYTRRANVWQQQRELVGTSFLPQNGQGAAVALDAAGTTLAVANLTSTNLVSNPLLWIFE